MKYCAACLKTYPTEYESCPGDGTRLQAMQDFRPGMIIRNKYEIIKKIGVGGMGAVYKARHLTFNEVCAIKIISSDITEDESFLRRFQTEAVVMRKLRHQNAVRVEDFDRTEDGRPFIVMELVEGRDLRDVIQKDGPLPAQRAVHIIRQVAKAIAVAHRLGIVHRDLKPQNIVLTDGQEGQETAKVLDFGIAKLWDSEEQVQVAMTMTGMAVGTPLYMSPEQYLGKKAAGEIDGRSDIYTLGIVLYQMVTGELPFDGDTPYTLMRQHLEATPLPPNELKPDLHIPESLSRVILKAIEKKREQRFQTAEEFIAALDEVVAPAQALPETRVAEAKRNGSTVRSSEEAAGSFLRKFFLYGVAAVVVALLVLSVGYVAYQSRQRDQLESAVKEKLRSAPSEALRRAAINVSVSREGNVVLEGVVSSVQDSSLTVSLAASVRGVKQVNNRLTVSGEDPLVRKGLDFLDTGDYPAAIDCFRTAASNDPENKRASDLLNRAQRAQQVEAAILKERR